MWVGKGNEFSLNLYNEQGSHQCKSFYYPPTGLDMTVLHILCLLQFPSIFPKVSDRYVCTTSWFKRPGHILFQSSLYQKFSDRNFSRNSPSERQGSWGILTSLSPLLIGISVPQGRGEVADFSLHSHSTSFAQWFLRKVYTDWEDGIRAGLVGGEGNPCSGNCSTQTQTPGARKRQPGKIFVHPDVNSVLLTSPSCLHLIRISSPRVCGGCGGHQDETGSTRSSQTWNQRLWEFLFCQLHWIYLEHHLF